MTLDARYSTAGTLTIGGVVASAIADAHATPCYVYDAAALHDAYQSYVRAFEQAGLRVRIHYACKANNNMNIMRYLKGLGAHVDVVSGGEMEKALKAGFVPDDVVYSSVGKTDAELIAAITYGIHQINAESTEELDRIAELAQRLNKPAHVALRVNPDVDAKTHAKITTGKKENKFGITGDQARAMFAKWAGHAHLKLVGLSVHIGSQLLDLSPYKDAYNFLADLTRAIRADGHRVERLDLGGGIGIVYRPAEQTAPSIDEYAAILKETVADLGCELAIEPGRSLVGNAGYLIARVIEIKKTPYKTYLVLDAAMNDLMRPAMYDAYHHIVPVQQDTARASISYDVVGPICETGDTFAKERDIQELHRGDLVAILSAGAYGSAMSSTYNIRPLAAEVICENGTMRLARKRQKLEELFADEVAA